MEATFESLGLSEAMLKALEKKGLLVIEMDDAHTMLLRIC